MSRIPYINITIPLAKCFICLLLFLLCACKEKPKESTTPQTVQPDNPGARGETEKMEAPTSRGEADSTESSPMGSGEEESLRLNVYPNPASNYFYLELSEVVDGMEYFIASSSGPTVLRGNIKNLKENIDISGLENGVYYITVTSRHNKPTLGRVIVHR